MEMERLQKPVSACADPVSGMTGEVFVLKRHTKMCAGHAEVVLFFLAKLASVA